MDGHERDDVVADRTSFCKRYLTECEPYCRCWVQLSMNEAKRIKDLDVFFGYHYNDIQTGDPWIEFHIDYWTRCTAQQEAQEKKRASLSVCVSAGAKPIMIIGQDESIFAQYLLVPKTWVGPTNGQRPLLPKSEGDGYMLAAFVSRELGYGRRLTDDELVRINMER